MIRVSVIVPNYNHGRFLRQRIDSILAQSYAEFELILLDDCSSDNSREIIETYRHHPKVTDIVYNEQNSGSPFFQWQKGIQLSKYNWVWIAESDDYADAGFLEQAVSAISQEPAIGLFYSDAYVVDERTGEQASKFSTRKNRMFKTEKWSADYIKDGLEELNECLKFDCTVNNVSSMVFNKKLASPFLIELHGFRYYGDWYLIIRLCLHGPVYYCSRPLNTFRVHEMSHTQGAASFLQLKLEYFRILELLYNHKDITGKKELLDYFALHYLNFGWRSDGWKNGYRMLRLFRNTDTELTWKLLPRLFAMKFKRR